MNIKLVLGGLVAASALSGCNGDESDEWTKEWVIKQHEQPVIVKPNTEGVFSLKAVKEKGKVVYYRVGFENGKMTENWKGVILFPRGLEEFPAWPSAAILPPFGSGSANDYKSKINAALAPEAPFTEKPNTNTVRLEGDMEVKMTNGTVKKEALTLYVVDGAVNDGSRLLIVQLRDTKGGTVQDGSGNGNPNN